MAPHSSTLAWKTPWMEEPGRLQSMESLRVRHDWSVLAAAAAYICQCYCLNLSHAPRPLSPCPQVCSLHLCLCSSPADRIINAIFPRSHIHALYVCGSHINIQYRFSASDLPHSVWQTLGSSTSLQMTQFHSFLWLIIHCVYVHLLYSFLCQWTNRLLHVLATVNSAAMNIGVYVSF